MSLQFLAGVIFGIGVVITALVQLYESGGSLDSILKNQDRWSSKFENDEDENEGC